MIKNYLKIAWRNLKKNRLYTLVNLTGLTLGIVSCLLIGIYIRHELNYDRFNINAGRIARVTMDFSFGGQLQKMAVTGTKVGPQFKRLFPGVLDYVRLEKRSRVVKYGAGLFTENNILYADPSIFNIFSFKLLKGNPTEALNTPDKIIVTQSTANKYFGDGNPIGKTLKVGDDNFMVSAVAADAPTNSQIKFDFIASFQNLPAAKKPEEWFSANNITYILLAADQDIRPLQHKINNYLETVYQQEFKPAGNPRLALNLEPLTSVHLHSTMPGSLEPGGSMVYIYILTGVALLILIIACVNYINLSIAQSAGRAAEIGVRKVIGAGREQLVRQFVGESMVITALAVLIAFGLAFLLLPVFNQLSGINFGYVVLLDPLTPGLLAVTGLLIGGAAGAYPALVLSKINLSSVLRAGFSFTSGHTVRRSLIVFQFVISIFLIVTTVIILQQLSYIRNKDIGYNKNNVVVVPVDWKIRPKIEGLKAAFSNIPGVESVGAANNEPVNVLWGDAIKTSDGRPLVVNALPMDENFIKTMNIKIVAGEGFDHSDVLRLDTGGNNTSYAFMLNETAVKALGWTPQQAIGRQITKDAPGRIKAVVKDFNFKSFHDAIGPLLIMLDHSETQDVFVRVNGAGTAQALQGIERIWKERVPERPFEYKFLDDDYDALYRTEQRTAVVFTLFSATAIILACLGLFAITAYSVLQRTKEIGIRKVLGATVSGLILLIAQDFLGLIVIAALLASPLAWYVSQQWLQDFAYRIHIHWWIFLAAGAASLLIAGFTVSLQATKAALANPVKSLKSE